MSRVQLALNVPDIDEAVAFYSKLFATEASKRKPGYANFAIVDPPLKLVLFEKADADSRLNHLGVEVSSSADVSAHQTRLSGDGLATVEESGTCCFAKQDKVWVDGPDGAWEIYAVLEDSDEFGQSAVACSLTGADDVAERLAEWEHLLAQATSRRSIDDGLALAFASGPDIAAEIARLSAAEVACCSWIDFTVRPMVDSTILEVRAAAAAQESLVALFGAG